MNQGGPDATMTIRGVYEEVLHLSNPFNAGPRIAVFSSGRSYGNITSVTRTQNEEQNPATAEHNT
jgi:hypothetical protein